MHRLKIRRYISKYEQGLSLRDQDFTGLLCIPVCVSLFPEMDMNHFIIRYRQFKKKREKEREKKKSEFPRELCHTLEPSLQGWRSGFHCLLYVCFILFLLTLFVSLFHFWLGWVFIAVWRLSQAVESGGYSAVGVCGLLMVEASLLVEHGLGALGLL